jgi:hypothetical protein
MARGIIIFTFFRAVFLCALALSKLKQDMDRIRPTETYFGLIGWKKPAMTEAPKKTPVLNLKFSLMLTWRLFILRI